MASHVTKVFISATSADLRSVRGLVKDALLNMGCLPVVQEHFPPDYRDVSGMLRDRISGCDALIHIAGMRYGAEPDPATLPEGTPRRSYTQMEVDLARELGLEKVFTFVCPESFPYETTDAAGDELNPEPEELQQLQQAHRERLLAQQELRYRVDSPEELGSQVRELQLELAEVKEELVKTRGKMLLVGAAIAAALVLLAGGLWWVQRDTGAIREQQTGLNEQVERIQQAPRVLAAYQERFREIRDDPSRETRLPNAIIDKMVRVELPGIVELPEETVTEILEMEAPRLAREVGTPIELKLKALFVMGEYDAVLEEGETQLVNATAAGLRTMGDAALAKFEQEQAKELRDDALRYYRGSQALINREEDPEVWATASMILADLLLKLGEFEGAEPLYREALAAREQVLGREHPYTLASINNLAMLLQAEGLYEEAEQLYLEGLETSVRVLGREHPDTVVSISNLALLMTRKGNYKAAEPLYREALEISGRVMGIDHPSTLSTKNNLALLLAEQGNYRAAEPLYREVLRTRERLLGREHPSTLGSINNLALLLTHQGNYEAAELLYREALETSNRVLGREHPDTLSSVNNLAALLSRQSDYEAAEPLYREALETRERLLGREHPSTLGSANNLARLLHYRGDYEAAKLLYRKALVGFEKTLGEDHPKTQVVRKNLNFLLSETSGSDED